MRHGWRSPIVDRGLFSDLLIVAFAWAGLAGLIVIGWGIFRIIRG